MLEYNLIKGNYVKYRSNRFAKIVDISANENTNEIEYSLVLLKEYPKGEESKVVARKEEITPIGLWGLGKQFWEKLGYEDHKETGSLINQTHQVNFNEIVIDFPCNITYSVDGYLTVGLTRVFLYYIDKTENVSNTKNQILEKAKEVSNEDELKSFLKKAKDVKFVHEIQNYFSDLGIDINAEIEKAILKFD